MHKPKYFQENEKKKILSERSAKAWKRNLANWKSKSRDHLDHGTIKISLEILRLCHPDPNM